MTDLTHSILQTSQLCRHYIRGPQTIRAVDEVDLVISPGEFLAVVGSSGSGKSTLLNLLAGLDTPTGGSIHYRGESLGAYSRQQLAGYRGTHIGMVFQSFNLIHHRTALENVELAMYFGEIPRTERRDRASAMLERLGLADRMTHRPADLSGGEQQRVAIARALVKEPAILCADEPTGNLDLENSRQIVSLMQQLSADGLTVIMVTHDLEMAGTFAGRTVKMHYGRIVGTDEAHGATP
jgi:putative ABC transport system ATP-binding protein